MKITDLYFGAKRMDFNTDKLVTFNIFNHTGVLESVARYVTKKDTDAYYKNKTDDEILFILFCDYWSRCEYEFLVTPWASADDNKKEVKVDVFEMFIKPNKRVLLDMVNQVTVNSARTWLREERKRRGRK